MPVIDGIGVLVVSNGQVLSEHESGGRTWVEGKPGEPYVLRFVCPRGPVFATTVEVDNAGVTTSSDGSWGYLPCQRSTVEPSECDLPGPRKGETETGTFRFASAQPEQGAQDLEPGTIGVVIYDNNAPQEKPYPGNACTDDHMPRATPDENMALYELGSPIRVITIYYASLEWLQAQGIVVS